MGKIEKLLSMQSTKLLNRLRMASHRDRSPYFLRHMGVEICIDPLVFSKPIIASIMDGGYEAAEARHILSLLGPGETVLEIGAGCGFLSTLMAKQPNCKAVHAVEANPELIAIIKATYQKNEVAVTLYNEVLGECDGEVEFFLSDDFWGSGLSKALGRRSVSVRQATFQSRLSAIRPTMIVCDIEGGEADLFRNADLSHINKIVVELHEDIIGPDGVGAVFDELAKRGFSYDSAHSSYSVVTFSRRKKCQKWLLQGPSSNSRNSA